MEANLSPGIVQSDQDERKGLPSASGLERIALCPGSWNLEKTLPPLPETPDAASGTRIHAALAGEGKAYDSLTEEEREMFEKCSEQLLKLAEDRLPPNERVMVRAEVREWFYGPDGYPVMSGKVDVMALTKSRGLIVDFKTGRNEVTESARNLQLRSQAVIMAENYGFRPFDVAIIQPWVSSTPDICSYTEEDLGIASREVLKILEEAQKPDAKRIPGEKQCDWCRAKRICPEANVIVADLVPVQVLSLTPQQVSDVLDRVKLAKKVIDDIEKWAKQRLQEDPNAIPGWTLEPGDKRRSVTSPQQAIDLLQEHGLLDQEGFFQCCDVKLGELEKQVRAHTGLKKKEAEAKVNAALKDVIQTKQNQPSLARIKENQ